MIVCSKFVIVCSKFEDSSSALLPKGDTWLAAATHCNTIQYAATQNTAPQFNTLRHTTLQHWEGAVWLVATTHCNTLQHTTTHCHTHYNTLCNARGAMYDWQSVLQYRLSMAIERVLRYNTLQHTLQHTQQHTLQHTLQHTQQHALQHTLQHTQQHALQHRLSMVITRVLRCNTMQHTLQHILQHKQCDAWLAAATSTRYGHTYLFCAVPHEPLL